MDMSLSKLQEMIRTEKPGVPQSLGLQRILHDWGTEQQQLHTLWWLHIKGLEQFLAHCKPVFLYHHSSNREALQKIE